MTDTTIDAMDYDEECYAETSRRRYFFRPEGGQWREIRWLTFQLVKFDLDRNESVAVVDPA